MADVVWAIGTSPTTFAVLGLVTGCWVLLAALIPQTPPPQVMHRIGGDAWQVVRLFGAHDIAHSWVTWMLITSLGLNCAGIAIRFSTGSARAFLLLAFTFAGLGFSSESLWTEAGEITLIEGFEVDQNLFAVERYGLSGSAPIQLPFVMSCTAEEAGFFPCDFHFPGAPPERKLVPRRGRGTLRVGGLLVSVDKARARRGSPWVYLEGRDQRALLENRDVVVWPDPSPHSPAQKKSSAHQNKIGAILTSRGPLLARHQVQTEDETGLPVGPTLQVGLPSHWPRLKSISDSTSNSASGHEKDHYARDSWAVRGARLLVFRFHRPFIPGSSAVLLALAMGCFLAWVGSGRKVQNGAPVAGLTHAHEDGAPS